MRTQIASVDAKQPHECEALRGRIADLQAVRHYHSSGCGRLQKDEIAHGVIRYLAWLREKYQYIVLRGIEQAGLGPVIRLPIETAYVPLQARPLSGTADEECDRRIARTTGAGKDRSLFSVKTLEQLSTQWKLEDFTRNRLSENDKDIENPWARQDVLGNTSRASREMEKSICDVSLGNVLGLGSRLIITGGVGSGKSTVLLHAAWTLATALLSGRTEVTSNCLGLTVPTRELPLPMFLPLAAFARYRRGLSKDAPARQQTLAYFVSHLLTTQHACFNLPQDFFEQALSGGCNVILLMDGLDEVANEAERAGVRQCVEELISGREAMRVIVTCRTITYRAGRTALGAAFRELVVRPLTNDHITSMVKQAYECIYPNSFLRKEREEELLLGIRRMERERHARLGPDAAALIDSPLMVRLLLIVHMNNRMLPDERAELFKKAIDALLQVDYGREESDVIELSIDWRLYRDMAQHLAFHMHGGGHELGREITEEGLKRAFHQEPDFWHRIEDFIAKARQRGELLEELGGVYRFTHLALQEFLVARYLREVIGFRGRDEIIREISEHLEDPWWREPVLLLVGYLAASSPQSARDLLGAMSRAGFSPSARFSAAEVAATSAVEWRSSGNTIREACARRIVELLCDQQALRQSSPIVRAQAGDRLSKLGDVRFNHELCHLPLDGSLGFVHIPAGSYDLRPGDSSDASVAHLGEFYIARFPVTVAQFGDFVRRTGSSFPIILPESRPVTGIDWPKARDYCEWLNEMLRTSSEFAGHSFEKIIRLDGWRVCLPTELQWEIACRGRGMAGGMGGTAMASAPDAELTENSANCSGSGVRDITVVGCFPPNGFGLHDMIGNTWELTSTRFVPGANISVDTPSVDSDPKSTDYLCVVRGGSFRDELSRAVSGRYSTRSIRREVLGFRLALRREPPRQ